MEASLDARLRRNALLQKEEILSRKTSLECFPDMMLVVLTGRCNVHCIMCPFRNQRLQDVPDHVLEQIPAFYPYLRVIEWEGGEAFVHRKFFELVRRAADYAELRQVITTNGLLFNDDWSRLIAQSDISLSISVDGGTQATYERIREGSAWPQLIRNLDGLNEALDRFGKLPRHQLNVVLMKSNVHEVDLIVDFAKRHRFARINFKMMKAFDYIPDVHGENLYAPENNRLLQRLIEEVPRVNRLCEANGLACNWPCLTTPGEVIEKEPYLAAELRESHMRVESHQVQPQSLDGPAFGSQQCQDPVRPIDRLHCVLPWRRLYIHPGGVSVACGCIPEMRFGENFDLMAFWNSSMMRGFREKIARGATDWCGMNCLLGRENRMSQQEWERWQGGIPVCGEIV